MKRKLVVMITALALQAIVSACSSDGREVTAGSGGDAGVFTTAVSSAASSPFRFSGRVIQREATVDINGTVATPTLVRLVLRIGEAPDREAIIDGAAFYALDPTTDVWSVIRAPGRLVGYNPAVVLKGIAEAELEGRDGDVFQFELDTEGSRRLLGSREFGGVVRGEATIRDGELSSLTYRASDGSLDVQFAFSELGTAPAITTPIDAVPSEQLPLPRL